jgi:TolA-binding protein
MKRPLFLAVGLMLAAAFAATISFLPDALNATQHLAAGGQLLTDMFTNAPHALAFTPLAVLRTNLTELQNKATTKIGELTDGLDADKVRAIEGEHETLLGQIRALAMEIKQREAAGETDTDPAPTQQTPPNPEATRAAETARVTAIMDLAARAGRTELTRAAIDGNVSVENFRAQLFDQLVGNQAPVNGTARTQIGTDATETTRAAMTEALSYGLGVRMPEAGPSEAARQYVGRGLIDLAAESINYRGGRVLNARQIDEILTRASHSTSDFPAIFENALNRSLEGRYALAQPTFKQFARQRNFKDFRPHKSVSVGDFPMLLKVLETGEIKAGTFGEGKESVQAFSYARRIHISRQMLINDDLGAIADLLASYGATVALFEEVTFYATAFNGKLADGKEVFHADHANLAGAGTAIDVDNVGKARAGMAKQKSLDGNPLLANSPRFLLTGPDKATEAEKLLATVAPANAASVNPFSGKLVPIESSQIAGNAWHLIGAPEMGSNWRWGYLEGYEAPRVRMEEPFGTQGFGMSVEHDFGAGAVDSRFAYKNPGAA